MSVGRFSHVAAQSIFIRLMSIFIVRLVSAIEIIDTSWGIGDKVSNV